MSSLPVCSIQTPSCGACGLDTTFEDGLFVCYDCGLGYGDGEDGTEAEFWDEDAEPCSHACDNHFHGFGKIRPGQGYNCKPCPLPSTHTSDHWHPCEPI